MALTKIEAGLIAANAVNTSSIGNDPLVRITSLTEAVTADKLANTAVDAGVYGGSTAIPVITVDAQGRLSNVVNTSIVVGDAYPHPFVFTSIGT